MRGPTGLFPVTRPATSLAMASVDSRNPLDLAQALIRCPSVTPDDAGALDVAEQALASLEFRCERITFHDADTPPIDNLFAKIGSGRPHLMLTGHTDVVPPGADAAWTYPPFSGETSDGRLFGRGAVDMKGGIACMIAAVARAGIRSDDVSGSLSFLITGDEEGPAINGSKKLLAWAAERGETFDAAILAEPTSRNDLGDTIKTGRRGSLSMTLTVNGTQGHVAYPHLADNPAPRLVSLLSAMTALELDRGNAHFDPSNLEIVSIDIGNPAFNVIPGEARARINIRFNTEHDAASLMALMRETVQRTAERDGTAAELTFENPVAEAFLTDPGPLVDMVGDAVEAETGRRPVVTTGGGTSDARFIKDHCPVVELGLVGQTMHQVDENTSLEDLETLTRVFTRILSGFFAKGT